MEWIQMIGESLKYIEEHITDDLTVEAVAKHVCVSPFYYQKGFAMLCGFTAGEYIRSRRLALAGSDIAGSDEKIIDIALKYGYDSPDSFTKAFTRFHGATPTAVRRDHGMLKSFAPLKIKVSLEGGTVMDYRIEKKEAFTVKGIVSAVKYEESKKAIPALWDELVCSGRNPALRGDYGICFDSDGDSHEYMIADADNGQTVPEDYETRVISAFTWAVFPCRGPLPQSLQAVNERIFGEWLPASGDYELACGICVEWYDDPMKYPKGGADENYRSEIWIPVRKK